MKIPTNAQRVFSGIIFDVYQWKQELYDGSKAMFEMVKRPDTVQIIATTGENIIIINEEQPGQRRGLSFLGGRVDPGEDALTAAKRELLEEAGMEAQTWELYATYMPLTKMDWTIYYYVARECTKIQEPHLEPGERITPKEVSFEQFIDLITGPGYDGRELATDILRAQRDGKTDELKKKIFGKNA
jgi:ADP-ribose pyrophosphatase